MNGPSNKRGNPTLGVPIRIGGTGGGSTVITQVQANTQTVTFSGLNGDVDKRYRMEGHILFPEAAGGEAFTIRINGATTNMFSNGQIQNAATGAVTFLSNTGPVAGCLLTDNGGAVGGGGGILKFSMDVYAVTGQWRLFRTWSYTDYNAVYADFITWGECAYKDTTTNIASLDITTTAANQILAGSQITLIVGD